MPGSAHDSFNFVFDESTGAWRPQPYTITAVGGGGGGGATLTKGFSILQEITTVSGAYHCVSPELDISDLEEVVVFIDHAPLSTSTPAVGTEYRIEVSGHSDASDLWRPLATFRSGVLAAATATAGASEFPGDSQIDLNPTPAYSSTDLVFFQNMDDFANSEWGRIVRVETNSYLTLQDGLQNTQASSPIYNQCDQFVAMIPVKSAKRIRAVCNNALHVNSYLVAWQARLATGSGGA